MTLKYDLDIELCSSVIGSAHRLTFDQSLMEVFLKGSGDMERTRSSRVKPITLNCDL